jgi:hypothetical protein
MKRIFVSLWFKTPVGNFSHSGIVTAKMINNKAVVSPSKIFKAAFGFELPAHSIINY